MIPGTTPLHIFKLPFDTSTIRAARVAYAQRDAVLLIKEKGALTMAGNEISVRLTQEETLRFRCGVDAEIQLRVLTTSGDVPASKIFSVPVDKCLDREVLE